MTEMKHDANGELLCAEAHTLLETMTDQQVMELIPYLTWILETPYNS